MGVYGHPYEPYAIQIQFMDALYQLLISEKKIGLFESPTGTGKTLSLACPSLTWLRGQDKLKLDLELAKVEQLKGPAFLRVAAKKKLMDSFMQQGLALRNIRDTRLIKQDDDLKQAKRARPSVPTDSYVLEDPLDNLQVDDLVGDDSDSLEALSTTAKVFFTSRTHSQLSQFVGALKTLEFEASWSDQKQPVKHVPLGSRKQLCVNKDVTRLSSATAINEKCQDLRQKHACPYFEKSRTPLKQALVSDIMDIEDLQHLGKKSGTCSYYAAREAVPYAEVVTLPYQLLMQESTRKTLGLSLRGSLVIVDEAHNISDTITSLNSVTVTRENVAVALKGLGTYLDKVGSRLSTLNKTRLNQTILVVKSLESCFAKPEKPPAPGTPLAVHELFSEKNVDTINLWMLRDWITSSKLMFKLDTYIRQTSDQTEPLVLAKVIDFLLFATDPASEGKLFWDRSANALCLSFLLLDPSPAFKSVVDEAAKVVLAGGTMEPFSDFQQGLFPQVAPDQVEVFSCGHIVPKSSILVRVVKGLELTFARRQDPAVINKIGATILELAKVVPAGLVVFFPSYSYLELAKRTWASNGNTLKALGAQKKIFEESKLESVEQTLANYTAHIKKTGHALMFAVVGGKLSEGINFSDDLARGVVMIGLPFPNAFSAEMIAKKEYIEKHARERGLSQQEAAQEARTNYENLSMRAVNQSVGRAIRHIRDYAAIYLIDDRYLQDRIRSKLSGWLRDSAEASDDYVGDTQKFFKLDKA